MRLACLALVIAACGGRPAPPSAPAEQARPSNVLRGDYAGSQACADCHGQVYASWAASPMRNMTRDAATARIRAPFDGASLRVGDDTCTVETERGARFMRVVSPRETHRFRVTKVVGGRYREDFVGVEVTGAPDPVTARGNGIDRVLPITYVFSSKTWRYKGYSVMVKERPAMSWKGEWAKECIGCHNTLPAASMLYDELYGPGLPAYQGKMSDRVLPPARTWIATPADPTGLARVLSDEIRYLGGDPPDGGLRELLPAAATTMEQRLDGAHLVELGIGCEACHNGARAHVGDPRVAPAFALETPLFGIAPPHGETGTRAQWINHTCAKCHTVLFTHYPWTWEGGKRRDRNPGGSSITSGEGRDYQLGGCSSQMPCTTCHDPHVEDPPDKLRALGTPAGNQVCTTCHPAYATDAAVERHSHHKLGSAGTACIACHMAKKNMGLDYVLERYHRIGSPTETRRVVGDRPLECALCHADKSVETIVSTMEAWWGKHYDRAQLRALYGDDLSVDVIRATLQRGKPHEQAVAIAVLGDARAADAIPALVPMLWHEYPLVRYFAQRALQTITGDPVAIDVGGPAAAVQSAAAPWLAAHHP